METNKKLIDLGILSEDEATGVKKVSLVEEPAIMLDFMYFNKQARSFYVDNEGMEKFKQFLDENKDTMKKPGGGPAGDGGVDHGAQMAILEEAGISTEYPFGYCFQIAQFLFYALGGYKSEWDLICIKKMEYQVDGQDFQSTHWYVQSQKDGRIIDLSAEQFEGILDIEDHYEDGTRANLGFPYYNVGETRVEFEECVPSLMTLKLYSIWKEQYGELEGIEEYYQACQYEEYRMSMQFSEAELPYVEKFVKPSAGESKEEFIGRCIPILRGEGKPEDQAVAICYSYWQDMEIDTAGLTPYADPGTKKQKLVTKAILMEEECPMSYNWMEDEYIVETILKLAEELGTKEADLADLFKRECFANPGLGGSGTSVAAVNEQGDKKLYLYKYEGAISTNSRPFCVGMVGLDNYYTKAQIQAMSDIAVNPGFGIDGASTYSIWSFKGGPNCKHSWRQYLVTMPNGQIQIEYVKPAAGRAGVEPIDMPKQGYYKAAFRFASEDKQILVGPAMVPDINIPRLDDDGDTYYVKFSAETIKEIAMKWMKEARNGEINTDHEENEAGAYIFESWIVETEDDKANTLYGYNVPKGTWMLSVKVDDKETWRRVKAGELRGFSIEGILLDMEELEAKKRYEEIIKIMRDK